MKFCFGDIVVVENNLIGVVVKDWCPSPWSDREPHHDVYVRYFNEIREYDESKMERYMVRHKYLSDDEIIWQNNAVHNNQAEYDEVYKDFLDIMLGNSTNGTNKQDKNRADLLEERRKAEKLIKEEIKPILDEYMNYAGINNDSICTRICNCLKYANICTLDKLLNTSPKELKRVRNMGIVTINFLLNAIYYYCNEHHIKTKYEKIDYEID